MIERGDFVFMRYSPNRIYEVVNTRAAWEFDDKPLRLQLQDFPRLGRTTFWHFASAFEKVAALTMLAKQAR